MPTPLARRLLGNAAAPALVLVLAVWAGPTLAQNYIQPSGMTQGQTAPQTATPGLAPVPAAQDAAPVTADPISDLLRQRGETYRRASDAQQSPEEVRTTSALNAEVAAQSALIDNADAAALAEYDAVQSREREEAAAAQARYEGERQAADEARLRYERDRAAWEATVAACQRGDRVRCRAGGGQKPMTYPDRPLPPGEPVG